MQRPRWGRLPSERWLERTRRRAGTPLPDSAEEDPLLEIILDATLEEESDPVMGRAMLADDLSQGVRRSLQNPRGPYEDSASTLRSPKGPTTTGWEGRTPEFASRGVSTTVVLIRTLETTLAQRDVSETKADHATRYRILPEETIWLYVSAGVNHARMW